MRPEHWLYTIPLRLRSLFRWGQADHELDDELRDHLERKTEEYVAKGMAPEEARRRARLDLGGIEQTKEKCRDARRVNWIQDLVQDLHYGLRMLRKSPGFTAVAVLTFALGIGANTAMFSVVAVALQNTLVYPNSDRLVALAEKLPQFAEFPISYPDFLDWARINHTFQALAAYRPSDFNLTGSGEAKRVKAMQVSASFFPLLGVKPVIGRDFSPDEDKRGAAPVVMLSTGFWKTEFGASHRILGETITLDSTAYTVIGVVPADFYFCCDSTGFQPGDVYIPVGALSDGALYDRNDHYTHAVGRLKRGVTLEQARADMDSIGRNLAATYPDSNKDVGIALAPLKERMVRDVKTMLLVLLATVGFVLLIACANVANLLLARSTGRVREFAIRTALGASHGRVIRQLLSEGILLALIGGMLGLLIALWGTKAGLAALPEALPRANDVRVDPRVLFFTLFASVLAGVLFGLAPAVQSRNHALREALQEGGPGSIGTRRWVQSVFVVMEMALAVVLVIGAGLMIRSLSRLWRVDPGFDPHNVLTFRVSLPHSTATATPDQFRATLRQLTDTVAAVPGVKTASLIDGAQPIIHGNVLAIWIEGRPKPQAVTEMPLT